MLYSITSITIFFNGLSISRSNPIFRIFSIFLQITRSRSLIFCTNQIFTKNRRKKLTKNVVRFKLILNLVHPKSKAPHGFLYWSLLQYFLQYGRTDSIFQFQSMHTSRTFEGIFI